MQVAVILMIASVGSTIFGSSRSSTRTSSGECIKTPLMYLLLPVRRSVSKRSQSRLRVLLVADMLAPGDGATALVGELHRDVGHEARRSRAVPVVLARLAE